MIENDQVGVAAEAAGGDLCHLAATGVECRVGPHPSRGDDVGNLGARRTGERLELHQPLLRLAVAKIDRDEQRAIAAGGTLKHRVSPAHPA